MLNDGGLYLNHGIHHEFHWRRTTQTDFLYRNVFPNGDLSGLTETLTEMERARWEVLDVENLRLHYARTCRHWAERLQARADEARAIVGERIYRTWLLYLTCSSVAFAGGSIGLYQVLMRKQWGALRVPPRARISTPEADADKGPSASLARARQALNVQQVRLGLPRPRRLASGPFSAPVARGSKGMRGGRR